MSYSNFGEPKANNMICIDTETWVPNSTVEHYLNVTNEIEYFNSRICKALQLDKQYLDNHIKYDSELTILKNRDFKPDVHYSISYTISKIHCKNNHKLNFSSEDLRMADKIVCYLCGNVLKDRNGACNITDTDWLMMNS